MEFFEQAIKGVWEIRLRAIGDQRGYFMRSYDVNQFDQHQLNRNWVQENQALSTRKGTLRGLHFQFPPFAETKLVRVIKGEILDVFLDLRKDSETFGQWGSILMSDHSRNMVLVPRGFAHGYCTLSEVAEVIYKVDNFYAPEHEGGIKWDDPDVGINWRLEEVFTSEKDARQPSFKAFCKKYNSINLMPQ
jgi:dTDP-4-dehydrorhamnose 3,5-epimerase